MELGALLKQARLDAGLSQRQLCGEQITRNMLSLIEHGSAQPSMETLRYLAERLGKPVSFFLGETLASPSIAQARNFWNANDPTAAMQVLAERTPDGIFDAEANLLLVLCCFSLAQTALEDGRRPYAKTLLEKAAIAGSETPYYTEDLERKRLILLARADPDHAADIPKVLPDDELLLRADVAYRTGDLARCAMLLGCATDTASADWNILQGNVLFALADYAQAREHYLKAEPQCLQQLEACCEKLGDYKMAYYYACKQRT